MPTATPSFESRQYWDTRFASSPESFDWLVSPSILIPPLLTALSHDPSSPETSPLILHIGCGTSHLPNLLRLHVPPSAILNVDFSRRAIELGIQREREEFGGTGTEKWMGSMSWATADLLNWQSIQRALGVDVGNSMPIANVYRNLDLGDSMPSSIPCFSIVIEKSCADAIACGEDVAIPIPYTLRTIANRSKATAEVVDIHPVCLLAIHLAALTKPGGTWIAFSYSESRFKCLYCDEDGNEDFDKRKKEGLVPDPGMLWTAVTKQEMVAQMEGMEAGVYRPRISHWLHVLRRTDYKVA